MSDLEVGEGARRRLVAPLPVANWQGTLAAVASLGIATVELEAGWLAEVEPSLAHGAFVAAGVMPLALHSTVEWALEDGAERMKGWAHLGTRYWMVEARQGLEAQLCQIDALAAEAGVIALLTNHPEYWPDGPELGRAASDARYPNIGACYDPAAAVTRRRHPFLAEMMAGPLKRAVRIVRLRDALFAGGDEVLPDLGNAELREVVSALEARSYTGWYALSIFGDGTYRQRLAAVHAAATSMLDQL